MPTDSAQLGLSLPNRGVFFGAITYAQMLEMAEIADRSATFGSVWVGDSIIAKPRPEAVVLLATLAARTTRLRLGPACMASFNLRHPIVFAAQWATLDAISGGRTILAACIGGPTGPGSGAGDFDTEMRAMGMELRQRVGRLEEGITILRRLWTEERVTHRGRYYQFEDVRVEPRPAQKPTPPIWIASSPSSKLIGEERFRKALTRVGSMADGWMTALIHPDEFQTRWQIIVESAQAAGRDPSMLESSQHLMLNLSRSKDAALAESKRFLDAYYTSNFTPAELARWGIFGSADECVGRLQAFLDAGCQIPIVRFTTWDPVGQLHAFIEEVAPRLRPGRASRA
jgi:alkanesulfonate monooxygenase SsuD/methylene tetrahydromethanopterin reductase-like flavin-dependent oxidoreductase (luciferase family)